MKKFFYFFIFLTLLANIFPAPNIPKISNESSNEELNQFQFYIFKEKITLDVFKRIMHCNVRMLLTMYEIRKQYFLSLDDVLKDRLVPIVADSLKGLFLTNKDKVGLKLQEDNPTEEETQKLGLIMQKERDTWSKSSNVLDRTLFNCHKEFIELMESIRCKLGAEIAGSVLGQVEFDDEEEMSKEEIKKETFLKLAEACVGYKSDERKNKEINKLNGNIDYLRKVLNLSL